MSNVVSREHIAVSSVHDLQQIASPLIHQSPIDFFAYGRNYPNHKMMSLQTEITFFDTWFKRDHLLCGTALRAGQYLPEYVLPAHQMADNKSHGYHNGLILIKEYEGFQEIFTLYGKGLNNDITNWYLNHQAIFESFVLYFKDKAQKIIAQAKHHLIDMPEGMNHFPEKINKVNYFLFQSKEYHFQVDNMEITLSKREFECLIALLEGKTGQQTANDLQVSIKTVEAYLANIRGKFQCKNRAEIFSKAKALGLLTLIS